MKAPDQDLRVLVLAAAAELQKRCQRRAAVKAALSAVAAIERKASVRRGALHEAVAAWLGTHVHNELVNDVQTVVVESLGARLGRSACGKFYRGVRLVSPSTP